MKNKTRWLLRKKINYAIKDLYRALRQVEGVREVVEPVHQKLGEVFGWCSVTIESIAQILEEIYGGMM